MTQPADVTPARPAETVPSKTEGVDVNAAIKAFKQERAKDKAEEVSETVAAVKETAAETTTEETAAPADEREGKPAEVEIPEKDALKVKLRAKAAARQRELEAREQRLAAWEAENKQRADAIEAQNRQIAEEKSRYDRLQQLRQTDPRAWLKEQGISLPELVNAELAEMSPEARAKQMQKAMQDLPKLIEQKAEEILKKREAESSKQQQEQARLQAVAKSEQDFVARVKDAEKYPATSKVATADPRFAVHTAYYIQSVFVKEHGRSPTEHELDHNVERYLSKNLLGESSAPAKPAAKSGKTSPRASAKEVTEKPLHEMSQEERMAAAEREFKRIREADKVDD